MATVMEYDYLRSIEADGRALLGIGADFDHALPIPACPGWTLRDLLEHVSGANRWVGHCVASGSIAQERILPSGPAGRAEMLEWAQHSVDELLAVLAATPPEELVWTPIRGPQGSTWWRRKAALEMAIHLTDAEVAVGAEPGTIDPRLALDGIDEFADEFLPLMLHGVAEPPPATAVLLSPHDSDESRILSLIRSGDPTDPGPPTVEIAASASELLRWMWNRAPRDVLTVTGDDAVVQWWTALAI